MTLPKVLACSMWREDAWANIGNRLRHLLAKAESYPNIKFLWVVGDSNDETAAVLREQTAGRDDVTVLDIGSTGIKGDDMASRLRRLSVTANHYLKNVGDADYVLIHESDIISPANLVNLLVANAEAGHCPIAAWPVLEIRPNFKVFYDVFCYRKDGVRFTHMPPYHPCYHADRPFIVDSAGTILMFHAEDAGNVLMDKRAILDLCWHLRELGRDIWVDPRIVVEQPVGLWDCHSTKEYA